MAAHQSVGDDDDHAQFAVIQRTSDEFWLIADSINALNLAAEPVDAGLLDLSRYIWPY